MPGCDSQYQSGQLQLDEMITRPYPLDGINYADLLDGEIIRGVIDFGLG
jgi:Zn-dependent alcohol dehydrogenase